jgi:hypothetical protein
MAPVPSVAPVPPAQRTPVGADGGVAVGRAPVPAAPEVTPVAPVPPPEPPFVPEPQPEREPEPVFAREPEPEPARPAPVAARTILPTREKGLLRRRTVTPAEPTAAPQAPRHGLTPQVTRPVGTPQHQVPSYRPAPPAAAPIPMPAAPVQAAPVQAAPVRIAPVQPAPAPAPVALPSRGPRHEVAAPAPAPAEVVSELSPLAQLSELASASYTPQVMTPAEITPPAQRTQPETEPAELVRRQPAAKPVGDVEEAEQPIRPRAAGDVRSMLSGFRAGVQRGRDGAHTNRPGHGVDNLRRD